MVWAGQVSWMGRCGNGEGAVSIPSSAVLGPGGRGIPMG